MNTKQDPKPLLNEKTFSRVILLNTALAIASALTPTAQTHQELWTWIQSAFLLLLSLEVFQRIRVLGWKEFLSSKTQQFELTLAIAMLPLLAGPLLPAYATKTLLCLSILKACALGNASKTFRSLRTWIKPIRESARQTTRALALLLACIFAGLVTLSTLLTGILSTIFPEYFGTLTLTTMSILGASQTFDYFWPIAAALTLLVLWIGAALAAYEMTAKRHEETENLLRNIHADMINLHDQLRNDLKLAPSKPEPPKDEHSN